MEKREKKRQMNTRAQMTIFIIIAIVIVVIILILFYPRIRSVVSGPSPSGYIESCAEEAAEEALEKLKVQGGSLEPKNYILYKDNKVDYACYTNEYYQKCVMQKPFLKQDIEKEVISYMEPKIKQCFESYKDELEKRGSKVEIESISTDVSIVPNSIVITINAPTTITKEGAVSFNKFKTDINSQLYDLVMLASSISNYEARYGDADTLIYMLYYPDIRVEKKTQEKGTRVYVLTYKPTDERFMFAVKSLTWQAGFEE